MTKSHVFHLNQSERAVLKSHVTSKWGVIHEKLGTVGGEKRGILERNVERGEVESSKSSLTYVLTVTASYGELRRVLHESSTLGSFDIFLFGLPSSNRSTIWYDIRNCGSLKCV